MNVPIPYIRFLAGLFLIALAAIALFDAWFPGLGFALGLIAILHDVMQGQRARPWQLGWGLIALSSIFWLHTLLNASGLGGWFTLVLVIAGTLLAFTVDLRTFLRL